MAQDEIRKLVQLSSAQKQRLEGAREDIAASKKALATLKRLGMDTEAIESQLKWAEEVQNTLLEEFT